MEIPKTLVNGCSEPPQPGQVSSATQGTTVQPSGGAAAPQRCRQLCLLYAGGAHSFECVSRDKVGSEVPRRKTFTHQKDCRRPLIAASYDPQIALLLELLQDGVGVEGDPKSVSPSDYRKVSAGCCLAQSRP
jgi:hypothetical protein